MGKIKRGWSKQIKSIENGVVKRRIKRHKNMEDYQIYDGMHPALVSEEDFMASLPALRSACGDRAVLRAKHFFDEDRRAVAQAQVLAVGDFSQFLRLVNASGLSSSLLLQNTWATSDPRQQAIPLALAMGQELLDGQGAIRVHGGGFGGTVQAFVPNELLPRFQSGMDSLFGAGACRVLHLRPCGGIVIE